MTRFRQFLQRARQLWLDLLSEAPRLHRCDACDDAMFGSWESIRAQGWRNTTWGGTPDHHALLCQECQEPGEPWGGLWP